MPTEEETPEVPAPRVINLSPEAAEAIRRILADPQPPTEQLRELVAKYQQYAEENPGW
jgi:hypothetical protein